MNRFIPKWYEKNGMKNWGKCIAAGSAFSIALSLCPHSDSSLWFSQYEWNCKIKDYPEIQSNKLLHQIYYNALKGAPVGLVYGSVCTVLPAKPFIYGFSFIFILIDHFASHGGD